MSHNDVLILIPARFASSRFPGKPLHEIRGKSMIQRVYENCLDSKAQVFVVTDDDKIENHVKNFGGAVVRIDDDVSSGSERIYLAYQRYFADKNFSLVVNVQGDEPLLTGAELAKLFAFQKKSSFAICTMVKRQYGFSDDFHSPDRVKAIYFERSGSCAYFSRAPIPYSRLVDLAIAEEQWFLHIGVYAYRPESLAKFYSANPSYYEHHEKLEQLRALDVGLSIGAIETKLNLIGVDSPADIKKVEGVLCEQEK
ncbi:MAG: hypothetical protein A2504_15415 [Bdellovibrionales bacterium RIFOXYD12_FULL_39_22]|nr:MAG: hypothetical protein A2385_02845 [Bdellovibrionales bacterium RIFOXYB1_FULL_39_21]OFZ43184.1 MAG: hypothetical protein A2485_11990 [Bdellovibrionales bacterium RIFOXYC12_FULL_39_17]OFZ47922.1 MAG: hypothetical protein A2404_16630 [Bdellovibrionales bacterium RIFOXYC1_FULL_39_130]OFZ75702.1 MAG: hypothetical protein A2560_13130 [Bdellovibrionales bacterium RIFOXYD1_FULL_39_84]OFZ77264.1 MAG: hypothetical protein A2451_06750 [Bdellovibrionales bacterium RIFOXYC2_FULL_39_8]OFZ94192.1 MAG: